MRTGIVPKSMIDIYKLQLSLLIVDGVINGINENDIISYVFKMNKMDEKLNKEIVMIGYKNGNVRFHSSSQYSPLKWYSNDLSDQDQNESIDIEEKFKNRDAILVSVWLNVGCCIEIHEHELKIL